MNFKESLQHTGSGRLDEICGVNDVSEEFGCFHIIVWQELFHPKQSLGPLAYNVML